MVLVQEFDMLKRIVSLSLDRSPFFAPIPLFQDDIILHHIFILSPPNLLISVILQADRGKARQSIVKHRMAKRRKKP